MEKRSWQRTSFWVFVVCFIITLVTDYFGISVKELMVATEEKVQKTYENMKTFEIWLFPLAILIKEEVAAWRNSKHAKEIEIEKIKNGIKSE